MPKAETNFPTRTLKYSGCNYEIRWHVQTADLWPDPSLVYIEQESEKYDYIFTIASQRMDGIWQTINLLAGTSLYFSTCSTLLSQPSDNPHQTFHCIRWNQSNNFTIHWVCRIHLGKTWRKTYWIKIMNSMFIARHSVWVITKIR